MTAADVAALAASVVATALADWRWLRVAQREHYLPGSATRFALRWWTLGPNRVLAVAAVLGVVLSPVSPFAALVGAAAIAVGPFRFRLRGRSPGPLVWTSRARLVAGTTVAVQAVMIAATTVFHAPGLAALVAPLVVDGALAGLRPLEDRRADRFVHQAEARLRDVHPTIVGITGSYGKTTTKVYAAHLIAAAHTVVPTPASFNNRAGLSRAINEHLVAGTEVFIAEMGTYGPGEIAAMCAWCPPSVAAITAIGPVHLERFGSEDAIVAAKSEILATADTVVLNVDDPRLARLADQQHKTVVRCSTNDPDADVHVHRDGDQLVISHRGEPLATVNAPDASAGNVAAAVALALSVGTPPASLASALTTLPSVANRRARVQLSTGATAVDDTFNSNPAGAAAALDALARLGQAEHKRVVVTPGMVELGARQADENEAFAEAAARAATHVVIVGYTNRAALLRGARGVPTDQRAQVMFTEVHEQAVEWVRANTGSGDVVLYEGQLPDHYP